MDHRDFILNAEKVKIHKIDDITLDFEVSVAVNNEQKLYNLHQQLVLLEIPIETGEEKQIYKSLEQEITSESKQSITLKIDYLDIQEKPHVRLYYKESEGGGRIKTYLLTAEDSNGNYKLNKIEDMPVKQ